MITVYLTLNGEPVLWLRWLPHLAVFPESTGLVANALMVRIWIFTIKSQLVVIFYDRRILSSSMDAQYEHEGFFVRRKAQPMAIHAVTFNRYLTA